MDGWGRTSARCPEPECAKPTHKPGETTMILDSHAHIFPEHIVDRAMQALGERYNAQPVARPTPDNLLRHMDECGVDRAVVLGVATAPGQVASINSFLTGLAGPRFIPFGSLHPHAEDVEDEIARLVGSGIHGVKLQPHFQGYGLEDPAFLQMLEAIEGRLVVLLHGGQEIVEIEDVQPTPRRLLALHQRFPQTRFVLAHLGAYQMWDEVEELLVGQDVYFDASYVFDICPDERIERIIRNHGADKIVWGSDFPWQPQSQGLAGMKRLDLPENAKWRILGENLAALLGL